MIIIITIIDIILLPLHLAFLSADTEAMHAPARVPDHETCRQKKKRINTFINRLN